MENLFTEAARLLFSEAGIVGILLVVAIIAIVRLHRDQQICNQARVTDANAVAKVIEESSKALNGFALAQESNNRIREAQTRATEMMAAELKEARNHISYLEKTQDKLPETLGSEIQQLRERFASLESTVNLLVRHSNGGGRQ